jgi:hypothetical protein
MAFKNSLKATLLEQEQPSPSSDAHPIFEEPALTSPAAPQPPERSVPRAAVKPPAAPTEAYAAVSFHARAQALCAMADTLPSKGSWLLITKIASLYDTLAGEAGWSEDDLLPPDDLKFEDEPPPEEAAQAAPRSEERAAFARRPLPLGRSLPRRRA